MTDARGVQLLFGLRDAASRELITAGAIPEGAELALPAVCGPLTSVTYNVYFDNPGAWALADFYAEAPAPRCKDCLAPAPRRPRDSCRNTDARSKIASVLTTDNLCAKAQMRRTHDAKD